jgi:phosphoglycerate dehydrogenase-like enzyme
MLNGLYILAPASVDLIYGEPERKDIAGRIRLLAPPLTPENAPAHPDLLREVEVIFSGWGAPKLDDAFMASVPNLKLFLYGAGSIRHFTTPAFWSRNIPICSAWAANALPVAEYTLAQMLFSLKHGWRFAAEIKRLGAYPEKGAVPGAYQSTVGIISLGMIGRRVAELLKPFDLRILAYDPFVKPDEAKALGVTLVPLETLFRDCDVVSLHTPWLKETEGLITGGHIASMKPGATFINTARGAIVRETEMIDVLAKRPDLCAVLDVTYPEPPVPGSKLYTLPNVILTPHIAGSMNTECRRMGRFMIDELDRFNAAQPLRWHVTEKMAQTLA